ncbi:hypothetical protein [Sphingobacterium humi]|uniref:Uncharacterized protein n=1 Tax=Sphingobacterium humi TaxID=1796905 RepID=A0A6N8L3R6_9SPHI|nr:hypothetical protein [Sphingobacterium humi]MVZ63669.1 hypothetical protein [Sphingobacterium humi]
MKNILTFKRVLADSQAEDLTLITNLILEIEEILRRIEEVKEFTYKGYTKDELKKSTRLLKIKFEIQWR